MISSPGPSPLMRTVKKDLRRSGVGCYYHVRLIGGKTEAQRSEEHAQGHRAKWESGSNEGSLPQEVQV